MGPTSLGDNASFMLKHQTHLEGKRVSLEAPKQQIIGFSEDILADTIDQQTNNMRQTRTMWGRNAKRDSEQNNSSNSPWYFLAKINF